MTDLQKAREYFANDKYATEATGIVIDEVGENYAKCSVKLDERHQNASGFVMGGVAYVLADFVFAVSTNKQNSVTVTTVSQISYFTMPKGDMLIGESRLLKDGKRNCFYEITIKDNLDNLIAVISTCGSHINSDNSKRS